MKLSELAEKEIIIYGTGYVGRKFFRLLQRKGLEHRVKCFAITGYPEKGAVVEGIPVYSINDVLLCRNTLVCLAVHESLREELEQVVRQRTEQYLWIYPYLYELMFGIPEQRNVEVSVARLLDGFREDLRLGIRLAAIEAQMGQNTYGFDRYIRAQMLYCRKETAEKRLQQFVQLIEEWRRSGYHRDSVISLNRRADVLDGCHRLSMAVYMGQEKICADIYPTILSAKEFHGCEVIMPQGILAGNGFTDKEIEELEKIQERYTSLYSFK